MAELQYWTQNQPGTTYYRALTKSFFPFIMIIDGLFLNLNISSISNWTNLGYESGGPDKFFI